MFLELNRNTEHARAKLISGSQIVYPVITGREFLFTGLEKFALHHFTPLSCTRLWFKFSFVVGSSPCKIMDELLDTL